MFSFAPSFFLFSPLFLLLFIVGQMGPMVLGMPMLNQTNTGPNLDNMGPGIHVPSNFTSRLDDQNRALLDKAVELGMKAAAEMNETGHISNETLAKLKEFTGELFDAMDENKDGYLTRQEIDSYFMEIAAPYFVEMGLGTKIENLTPDQRAKLYADLNARMPEIKAEVEKGINKMMEEADKNGDGMLSKEEVEMKADEEMAAHPVKPFAHHLLLMRKLV